LASFGFEYAAALAAPDAGVADFDGEFFAMGLDVQVAAGLGLDADFERLAFEKDRVGAGGDFDSVGGELASIEAHEKARAFAGNLNYARPAGDLDFELH